MSAFTILVLVVAAVAFGLGFRRGLIAQAGAIIALVGGIMACRIFGPDVIARFGNAETDASANTTVLYAIVFLVAYFVILLAARLIRGVVGAAHLGVLDRLAGGVFKTGVWMLILSVLLNVWAAVAPTSDLTDTRIHPERAYVLKIAPAVCGYVMEQAAQNSHIK